jgi:hypothetical protein
MQRLDIMKRVERTNVLKIHWVSFFLMRESVLRVTPKYEAMSSIFAF